MERVDFTKVLPKGLGIQTPDLEKPIIRYRSLFKAARNWVGDRTEILKNLSIVLSNYKNLIEAHSKNEVILEEKIRRADTGAKLLLKSTFKDSTILDEFNKREGKIEEANFNRYKSSIEASESSPGLIFLDVLARFADGFLAIQEAKEKNLINSVMRKYYFIWELYDCIDKRGIHPNIFRREEKSYCILVEHTKGIHGFQEASYKLFIDWKDLEEKYINLYKNQNNVIQIDGKVIPIKSIVRTLIIKIPLKKEEVPLYVESKGIRYDSSDYSIYKLFSCFENESDSLLPSERKSDSLLEDVINAAISLKDLLITKRKVKTAQEKSKRNRDYKKYRSILFNSNDTWSKAPSFIKENTSFDEFYSNNKNHLGLNVKISTDFAVYIKFLEGFSLNPLDLTVKNVLSSFDTAHIRDYWNKSIETIVSDPEEAITRSKALLESIFKHILDSKNVEYDDSTDEFPKLYKKLSKELELSPGGNYEPIFNQILSGCTSVVEGVGAVRNKLGSAHGKSKRQAKHLPLVRHAELVVNLSGAMAIFIIDTWNSQK